MLLAGILTTQPAEQKDRQTALGRSHSHENSYQFRHVCPSFSSHVISSASNGIFRVKFDIGDFY
jgi:hypothetical protein